MVDLEEPICPGRLPDRRQLNDKLTALFEPRHARWDGRISFETRKSMGGSIATSFDYDLARHAKLFCFISRCAI